jgi:hypothetical protein
MSKKHFAALAAGFRQVRSENAWETWYGMVQATANVCAQANARFDRERFYRACGINPHGRD